jgi:hypothetical protein
MSRELTSHRVNSLNNNLDVLAVDERGHGGANHEYVIRDHDREDPLCEIHFQNGVASEVGCNGVTNEALLAIVEDRLQGFQSDRYSCRENAIALTKIQEAMMWLNSRTMSRIMRGVEGTHDV